MCKIPTEVATLTIYKDLESFFDGSIECMQNKKAQIIILKPATESNFSNIFTFEPVIRKTRQSTLLMYESMEVDEEAPVVAGAEAMLH
ncbi:hypothetical protein [Piscirickettsia salmonis]|uniref:hypothetical protein n=2 Tax=Piscirickettsia salmonis TaxID=1238 RepID=UPI0018AC9A8E|nr:hypothetical protein [Piscirickettsia salmonis]